MLPLTPGSHSTTARSTFLGESTLMTRSPHRTSATSAPSFSHLAQLSSRGSRVSSYDARSMNTYCAGAPLSGRWTPALLLGLGSLMQGHVKLRIMMAVWR